MRERFEHLGAGLHQGSRHQPLDGLEVDGGGGGHRHAEHLARAGDDLSLIHISEPTRLALI
eukprot:5021387-Alexandrium_andersonii.AAC.1